MKKILKIALFCCLFFTTFLSSAQTTIQDYLNTEQLRIQSADSVEVVVTNFISSNINNYVLTPQKITEVTDNLLNEHDGSDIPITGNDLQSVLLGVKKDELRNLYFNQNPGVLNFFDATVVPTQLRIECINGGFETGNVANYNFRSVVVNPSAHLDNGCSINNNSGAFLPTGINQYLNRASIVDSGNEPFLAGLSININKVHTGNFALKINPNPIDAPTLQIGNVTSVNRDFVINGNTIDFSYLHFGYVVPSGHIQPFFRYRLYSINSTGNVTGILRDVCIPMNINDCEYLQVPDNRIGLNTLSYTPNWICQQINTADLINTNVRLEFTVSDCQFRGHFTTVYIDDLCGVSCPPTWGAIHLNNININCPVNPFQICGNFQLPANGGNIGTMSLNVLNNTGTIVGTINNSTITGQNFCFTVNPAIFGVNPIGNYTFQVNASIINNTCISLLTDTLGTISFNNCCQATLILTNANNMTNNDLDAITLQERSDWIRATNIIGFGNGNFGDGVVYHAGNFVELNPGFEAAFGSQFATYPEGCTTTPSYVFRDSDSSNTNNTINEIDEVQLIKIEKEFTIIPNPSSNFIALVLKNDIFNKILVTTIDGKTVYEKAVDNRESLQIDISGYANGLYLVSVLTEDGQVLTEKLIKN